MSLVGAANPFVLSGSTQKYWEQDRGSLLTDNLAIAQLQTSRFAPPTILLSKLLIFQN